MNVDMSGCAHDSQRSPCSLGLPLRGAEGDCVMSDKRSWWEAMVES